MGEHVHVHGRHAFEHRRLVGIDAGQDFGGVEARVQNQLQAVKHGAVEDDVAVDMRAR